MQLWVCVSVNFVAKAAKENFHHYQQNTVKKVISTTSWMHWKKITAIIANLTNIHRANFNAYHKFTGNIKRRSYRWRRGIGSWWHAGDDWFEPVYSKFLFVRNPVNAVKKIFTAINCKNLPYSTLKFAGALRWKTFFSPLFTSRLTFFVWLNLEPGSTLYCWIEKREAIFGDKMLELAFTVYFSQTAIQNIENEYVWASKKCFLDRNRTMTVTELFSSATLTYEWEGNKNYKR